MAPPPEPRGRVGMYHDGHDCAYGLKAAGLDPRGFSQLTRSTFAAQLDRLCSLLEPIDWPTLHAWLGGQGAGRPTTIRITAAEISRLQAEWQARWNRPPTPEEMEGVIRVQIREAVLYQEALSMGLVQDDPIVRRVLVQKLERMARDLVELSLSPTDQDLEPYFA